MTLPAAPMFGEHLPTGPAQTVVATAALPGLFDPSTFNPPPLFETVEHGIQRRDMESQRSLGLSVDLLRDVVAVPSLVLQERKDQQLRTALLQLAGEFLREAYMCDYHIYRR